MAPARIMKGLTWIVGWISESQLASLFYSIAGLMIYLATFGWIAVAASAPFLSGTMIQGLLVLNYENYSFERWHGTLIYWAILVVSAIVNIQGSRVLPLVENLSLGFHVLAFIIVLVVICEVSPTRHTAEFVFVDVTNDSGWESEGIVLVGMYAVNLSQYLDLI